MVYRKLRSIVSVSQRSLPFAASSATSLPSSAPTKTFPFQTATPRLTTSQHAFTAHSGGTFGSYDQRRAPVAASNAKTLLQALVTYITPSTTIAWLPARDPYPGRDTTPVRASLR